jgi:Dehydrogenase E1 component
LHLHHPVLLRELCVKAFAVAFRSRTTHRCPLHENPLLPNAKLRELFALMQRARALSKAPASAPRFEAILCATLMHIEPGDYISPPPNAPVAVLLAAERTRASRKKFEPAQPLPAAQRLAVATGIAQGLKLATPGRFAVVYTDAGSPEPGWQQALTYATTARLPLILVIAGVETPRAAKPKSLTWPALSKLAKKLHLPILTVDGTDAVAVYRVMQESAHRARLGDGVAVIWCALPTKNSATTDPIRNMETYLAARNLLRASKKNRR